MYKGQYREAISLLEKAATLQPKNAIVFQNLGNSFLKIDQKEKALINFKKSLKLNPNNKNLRELLKKL